MSDLSSNSGNPDAPDGPGDLLARLDELTQGLRQAIDGTEGDFGRMPFFVRPMARRGFAQRTGKSVDDWRAFAADLERAVAAARRDPGARARLAAQAAPLEALAESYRTAPERAARAMRGDPQALAQATARSREREQAVRELMDGLRAAARG